MCCANEETSPALHTKGHVPSPRPVSGAALDHPTPFKSFKTFPKPSPLFLIYLNVCRNHATLIMHAIFCFDMERLASADGSEGGRGSEVLTPCAACKVLRRKCSADKCVLAPYFPPAEPHKFLSVHRVFGASNVIRLLQEIEEEKRGDAVKSMVYEANARVRDPIYGCSGIVYNLHRRLAQLQSDLAATRAQLLNIQLLYLSISSSFATASNSDLSLSPPQLQLSSQSLMAANDEDEENNYDWDWEMLW